MREQFGDKLKKLRSEKNMTQEELAKLFNTGKASISNYENNSRLPDAITISKYADFFGVSVDYILGRTDIRNSVDQVHAAVKDDPELAEFWDIMKERESLQILFKQAKQLDDKDIKQMIRIIKAIEDEEANE